MKQTLFALLLFAAVLASCKQGSTDEWEPANGEVELIVYNDSSVDGNVYINQIYINTGTDTLKKIKYELIGWQGNKADTEIRIIAPQNVLRPGQKRLVPRHIGEKPSPYDYLQTGKVWVEKMK